MGVKTCFTSRYGTILQFQSKSTTRRLKLRRNLTSETTSKRST